MRIFKDTGICPWCGKTIEIDQYGPRLKCPWCKKPITAFPNKTKEFGNEKCGMVVGFPDETYRATVRAHIRIKVISLLNFILRKN